MPIVTTSLTVGFGQQTSDGFGRNTFTCEIEADSEIDFNKKKSSFYPGDTVYISLFKGIDVANVSAGATAGSLSLIAVSQVIVREEVIAYEREDTAELSLPAASIVEYEWYGNSLGSIIFTPHENRIRVPVADGLGLLRVKYNVLADIYVLSGVPYPSCLVAFSGETP